MEAMQFTGKTVNDAITAATVSLGITSDQLQFEIIEKGSSGFLGLGSKDAVIKVYPNKSSEEKSETKDVYEEKKEDNVEKKSESVNNDNVKAETQKTEEKSAVNDTPKKPEHEGPLGDPETGKQAEEIAVKFLKDVFATMDIDVSIKSEYDENEGILSFELSGPDMGIIIGKRGATLDSLQYLVNLAVNRKVEKYTKVKVDTEDYRRRRKETLERLAKNVAFKVRKTRRPVSLEPMNPYERRIIHFALQNEHGVTTHSEGEEPRRHIVVSPKR
ncbi:MAG: protein jag [Lachnospiraceae bacterium]|nr:protein jag [Lachnospiraceae bacterium]